MTPIHFNPNEPQVLSLKDPAGVLDGFNVLYETTDGRLLSLPRPAAVKLNMLDPLPGEEISVTKYRKNADPAEWPGVAPAEWVICLTPKSEQARAEREEPSELAKQLAESLIRCSDCKQPAGKQHKPGCHRQGIVTSESDYRDSQHPRPIRRTAAELFAEGRKIIEETPPGPPAPAKGTGTYGPAPQPVPATRRRPEQIRIPFNLAFKEVVAFVCHELNASGEQWSEQSRQDLVSTVLIAASKAGYVGVWER